MFFSADCLPISAEHDAEIMLFNPLIINPKKNMSIEKLVELSVFKFSLIEKLITEAQIIAINTAGDLFE